MVIHLGIKMSIIENIRNWNEIIIPFFYCYNTYVRNTQVRLTLGK